MHPPEIYMNRALDLAKLGLGTVAPNPMVGCVIVHNNRIIGEGYHQQYGGPHAEVNAIKQVEDKTVLAQSTLYVTLEPCCHFGKTPPCANLILEHKIPRVYVGSLDPFASVNGGGIALLRAAGVAVQVGVLQQECQFLNRRFFTFHTKNRPYVIAKWAQSSDGFIGALEQGKPSPVAISNAASQMLSHKWRTEEQAILVGTTTAISDNPQLTARHWQGKNPLRVVLDAHLKIPTSAHVLADAGRTLIFYDQNQTHPQGTVAHKTYVGIDFAKPVAAQMLAVLHQRGIPSVVVEGGGRVLGMFFGEGLVDECRVITASNLILHQGTPAPGVFNMPLQEQIWLQDNVLGVYYF